MMSNEREDNKVLADRLRGMAGRDTLEAGKQLSTQVGKVQSVQEIGAPTATPSLAQDQSNPVRERHVAEGQDQNQIGKPGQPEQTPSQGVPEKSMDAGKDKSLAEISQGFRQGGVTGGRAANDVASPTQTPAVTQRRSQEMGR